MSALNLSLLSREYILMNVLKALALIICMCNLYVILLSNNTPRYCTLFTNGIFRPFNVRRESGGLFWRDFFLRFPNLFAICIHTFKYNQQIVCWEARAGRGVLCSTPPWSRALEPIVALVCYHGHGINKPFPGYGHLSIVSHVGGPHILLRLEAYNWLARAPFCYCIKRTFCRSFAF
jgi:hypothetical protein